MSEVDDIKQQLNAARAHSRGEVGLLAELGAEIANFRDGFRSSLTRTYILSPYASMSFGLSVVDDKVLLGVPEKIWTYFKRMRLESAEILDNRAGVFLVFWEGEGAFRRRAALRIFMRSARTIAIKGEVSIVLNRIASSGVAGRGAADSIELPLHLTQRMLWEC